MSVVRRVRVKTLVAIGHRALVFIFHLLRDRRPVGRETSTWRPERYQTRVEQRAFLKLRDPRGTT